MNKNLKKIITASLITAASLTAVGCGTTNAKLAKNIDKGMADFVSSINNLDYVDTGITTTSNNKIGKIIETSNTISDQYLTKTLEELTENNPITLPSNRTDNFKLFTLSNYPFISLTTDDNSAMLDIRLNLSTAKLSESSNEINSSINDLILKRSILMIYVNEIYNNRVNLSNEDRVAINAYVNVIKENSSYLKGNRGMVKNQLSLANNLISDKSNENLINYYLIKSGETLETRASKIDATISAIDSIINIIEANLTSNSLYYNANLSSTYEDILSQLKNSSTMATTENKTIADNIANSLSFISNNNIVNNDEFKIGEVSNQTKQNASNISNNSNQKSLVNNNQSRTLELNKNQNNNLQQHNQISQNQASTLEFNKNQFNNLQQNNKTLNSINSINNKNNSQTNLNNQRNSTLLNNKTKTSDNNNCIGNNCYNNSSYEQSNQNNSKPNTLNNSYETATINSTNYKATKSSNNNYSNNKSNEKDIIRRVPYVQNLE